MMVFFFAEFVLENDRFWMSVGSSMEVVSSLSTQALRLPLRDDLAQSVPPCGLPL